MLLFKYFCQSDNFILLVGTCIIHAAQTGAYVRSIYLPTPQAPRDLSRSSRVLSPVRWLGISSLGHIVVYCLQYGQLHLCSINGRHLCTEDTGGERLQALIFSRDGRFLVTGGSRKGVTIRNTHDLRVLHRLDKLSREKTQSCQSGAEIRSLATTSMEQHLLVGLQTGELEIFALNEESMRKMFVDSLDELGF